MNSSRWCVAVVVATWLAGPALAQVGDANTLFSEAVRLDLSGDAEASRAFELYRRAAEAGLPAAQFNVGVMLDSGRGTARDVSQAAVWYARAASHDNKRAAYNLAQLYEAGQGVPKNGDVARTWFEASGLPAARSRILALQARKPGVGPLVAPICVSPDAEGRLHAVDDVELVWIAPPQSEPVRFFVELRAVRASASEEVFSGFTDRTSIVAPLRKSGGNYVWRVLAVGRRASDYAASEWSHFTIPAQ